MKRVRLMILALLAATSLLLNIERLDFGMQSNVVNIQGFVYGLAAVAVFLTLLLPAVTRLPAVLWVETWICIYLLAKLVLSSQRPIIGGIYTYLSITEVTLLSILVFLAHRFSRELRDAEEMIAALVLPEVSRRVKRLEDAGEEIDKEFIRSRRRNLLMSILILEPDPRSIKANLHRSAQEVLKGMMRRYVLANLVSLIDREMRRTDLVLEQPDHQRFILLLPDTDAKDTHLLAERIHRLVQERLGIPISFGAASFPDKALTFEELLRAAELDLHPTAPQEARIVQNTDIT